MRTAIPLILAVLILPMSFFASGLRTHRYGYAVPLVLAALLLSATLLSGDPLSPTLFFVVVALGIACNWWSTARPPADGV
jgi:hypothetical protein